MILGAVAKFRYFFRPFRRGAYQHAPSIEELYVMRQRSSSRITSLCKRFARTFLETRGRSSTWSSRKPSLLPGSYPWMQSLMRLETDGEPEEVLERIANTSTRIVGQRNRLRWWGQPYSDLDQQAPRVERSAELSRDHES